MRASAKRSVVSDGARETVRAIVRSRIFERTLMSAYKDKRDGRWRFRKWIKLPDGKRIRITGTPPTDTKVAGKAEAAITVAAGISARATSISASSRAESAASSRPSSRPSTKPPCTCR